MQRLGAALQVHGAQQAKQPEIVVAVQVRNKDGPQVVRPHAVLQHLPLGAFATVNQVIACAYGNAVGWRESTGVAEAEPKIFSSKVIEKAASYKLQAASYCSG